MNILNRNIAEKPSIVPPIIQRAIDRVIMNIKGSPLMNSSNISFYVKKKFFFTFPGQLSSYKRVIQDNQILSLDESDQLDFCLRACQDSQILSQDNQILSWLSSPKTRSPQRVTSQSCFLGFEGNHFEIFNPYFQFHIKQSLLFRLRG